MTKTLLQNMTTQFELQQKIHRLQRGLFIAVTLALTGWLTTAIIVSHWRVSLANEKFLADQYWSYWSLHNPENKIKP